jgi:phosphatidylinositol alpha-mannosyltransferase
MALGKPVVASNIPGYAGVLTHEQEGLLVKPRNAHDLAKAISRLVEDKLLRDRLGRQGLATVGNFSWEKVALRVEEYYRQVLARCGKPQPADAVDGKTPESLPA